MTGRLLPPRPGLPPVDGGGRVATGPWGCWAVRGACERQEAAGGRPRAAPAPEWHCPLHVRIGQAPTFLPGLEVLGLSCFRLSGRRKQAVPGTRDRVFLLTRCHFVKASEKVLIAHGMPQFPSRNILPRSEKSAPS